MTLGHVFSLSRQNIRTKNPSLAVVAAVGGDGVTMEWCGHPVLYLCNGGHPLLYCCNGMVNLYCTVVMV